MYDNILTKVRAIINDPLKTDGAELFEYTDSARFTLAETNVTSLNGFRINNTVPDSNEIASLGSYNEGMTGINDFISCNSL